MTSDFTVGLIGAGGIAPLHVAAWQALDVDVINYALEGSSALCERYGVTAVASREELLERCDAVDVCTPTDTHAELVLAAAAAGKPIVCEKPIARTSDQAREMINACASAGVLLYPAHVVRFFPAYAAAQRTISHGDIGEVAVQRYLRMGKRPTQSWFADPVASGGIIFDLMIHDIDFARWIAGDVVQVFARDSGTLADPDAAVSAHAILTHAGGEVSECTAIWRPGGKFDTRFTVAGSGGMVNHERNDYPPFTIDAQPAEEGQGYVPTSAFSESPYLTEIREFLTAFRGGPEPKVTAADGLAALMIAEAAVASARSGQPVRLSPREEVTT